MALGDVYRCTASFRGPQGQTNQWVWHYVQTNASSVDTADLIDAILVILTAVWDFLKQYIADSYSGDSLDVQIWSSTTNEWIGIGSRSIASLDGEDTSGAASGNVAPFIGFYTDWPKRRGKKFLFGVGRDLISDGRLSTALILAMADAGFKWAESMNIGFAQISPCTFNQEDEFVSQYLGNVIGISLYSGSQYRRLPGRGA